LVVLRRVLDHRVYDSDAVAQRIRALMAN